MMPMPFKPNLRKETEKVVNSIGEIIFPILLTINVPTFVYQIVLEKEMKLIQNMRINGLRMINYWIVNYIYNYIIYLATATVFYLYGVYATQLTFFTESSPQFFFLVVIGWGLNCVSMSFFISSFLNSSQNASLIGYSFSIIGMVLTSTMVVTKAPFER
jgi:hypothetical protein